MRQFCLSRFPRIAVIGLLLYSSSAFAQEPPRDTSQLFPTDHDKEVAECLAVDKPSFVAKPPFAAFGESGPVVRSDYSSEESYESVLYDRAIYAILEQHALHEYSMHWKYLYGFVYSGRPPEYNPFQATINDVDTYLRFVPSAEGPAGILVYWYSQRKRLCVGLVLPGKRMLVEPSSVVSSTSAGNLLPLREEKDRRVARRRGEQKAEGSPTRGITLGANRPVDLFNASRELLPGTIGEALGHGVVRSLLVVPIGHLGAVPFAALPVTPGNDPLISFTTITVAPGFDVLLPNASSNTRRTFRGNPHAPGWKVGDPDPKWTSPDLNASSSTRRTSKRALIVGDPDLTNDPKWIFPDLPGARREATDVATLLGVSPLLGSAATHADVLTALADPKPLDLIYFATHAVSDPANPQDRSFVALRGGNLYTRQVEKLKLKGKPLVVLSACQTGLGKEFAGGIFGMAIAWHFAGADAVVISLWNVDDATTYNLMVHFMKRAKHVPPSKALAEAMLQQRAIHPHSLDWASFTIYGGLPK